VIHSWWVPDLAIKKDAIPGIINEVWFRATETGTFRGQCAELCGKDHGYMPIVVEVVEPDAYQAWVDTRQDGGAQVAQMEN
jgi:cytochrome c oxidase subunit 2